MTMRRIAKSLHVLRHDNHRSSKQTGGDLQVDTTLAGATSDAEITSLAPPRAVTVLDGPVILISIGAKPYEQHGMVQGLLVALYVPRVQDTSINGIQPQSTRQHSPLW